MEIDALNLRIRLAQRRKNTKTKNGAFGLGKTNSLHYL